MENKKTIAQLFDLLSEYGFLKIELLPVNKLTVTWSSTYHGFSTCTKCGDTIVMDQDVDMDVGNYSDVLHNLLMIVADSVDLIGEEYYEVLEN